MPAPLYISYALSDAARAVRLRGALQDRGIPTLVDDHRAGERSRLTGHIVDALDGSAGVVVLATAHGIRSRQVRAEVAHVIERGASDRLIVAAWGLTIAALARVWPSLAATGPHALPDDPSSDELARFAYLAGTVAGFAGAMTDACILDFHDVRLVEGRVVAQVSWDGASGRFTSPLGTAELDDLRWYLESYLRWPEGVFRRRAEHVEGRLPAWGEELWQAVVDALGTRAAEWAASAGGGLRRMLTIRVPATRRAAATAPSNRALSERFVSQSVRDAVFRALEPPPLAASRPATPPIDGHNRASGALLRLPWELVHQSESFLARQSPPVAIRRVIAQRSPPRRRRAHGGPVRVLMVIARPLTLLRLDPRVSAEAVIDALTPLGPSVELHFLRPPTLAALAEAVHETDYDVLHFDGHGIHDVHTGLGYLCFEHRDPERRRSGDVELVHGAALREAVGDHAFPIVFLEACQVGLAADGPPNAVASALLAAGAESVIAMSYSVRVETARRFTGAFYRALIRGRTVADAVARARQSLAADRRRGAGELTDWLVPVLVQRDVDRPIVPEGMALLADPLAAERLAARHRTLPVSYRHGFVGRLAERLELEIALEQRPIALLLGVGGQGKTSLAADLGRWLVRCERVECAVFVSLAAAPPLESVLTTIGRALSGGEFAVLGLGSAAIDRAIESLREMLTRRPALVIIDNLESVLPAEADGALDESSEAEPTQRATAMLEGIWRLTGCGQSRLLLTSREPLDDPRFAHGLSCHVLRLGPLQAGDALALLTRVCRHEGVALGEQGFAELPVLADALGRHAHSLVLVPAGLGDRSPAELAQHVLAQIARMDEAEPTDQERSLIASIRVSLGRVPAALSAALTPLGCLRVGLGRAPLLDFLELDETAAGRLLDELQRRGLAYAELDGAYLRLHPGLLAILRQRLTAAGDAAWDAASGYMTEVLRDHVDDVYDMWLGPERRRLQMLLRAQLPELSTALTRLASAESNVEWIADDLRFAVSLETMLGHEPRVRGRIEAIRRRIGRRVDDDVWAPALHMALMAEIDALTAAHAYAQALERVEALGRRHADEQANGSDYAGADVDRRETRFTRARLCYHVGRHREALAEFDALCSIYEAVADGAEVEDAGAALRMASLCRSGVIDCLTPLGRYADAIALAKQAVARDEQLGDAESLAVSTAQLAQLHLTNGEPEEALEASREALARAKAIDWASGEASEWYTMSWALEAAGRLDEAEDAAKQGLALYHDLEDRAGVALVTHQLAIIAFEAGRLEDALEWDRRSLAIRIQDGPGFREAESRNNLAETLRLVGRLDEAEVQAQAAVEIKEALGASHEPWLSWNILHQVARDRGDRAAAIHARAMSIEWYRRFRDAGGSCRLDREEQRWFEAVARSPSGRLPPEVFEQLTERAQRRGDPDDPQGWVAALARALLAVALGPAGGAPVPPDALHYLDVVEVERLTDKRWPR